MGQGLGNWRARVSPMVAAMAITIARPMDKPAKGKARTEMAERAKDNQFSNRSFGECCSCPTWKTGKQDNPNPH